MPLKQQTLIEAQNSNIYSLYPSTPAVPIPNLVIKTNSITDHPLTGFRLSPITERPSYFGCADGIRSGAVAPMACRPLARTLLFRPTDKGQEGISDWKNNISGGYIASSMKGCQMLL